MKSLQPLPHWAQSSLKMFFGLYRHRQRGARTAGGICFCRWTAADTRSTSLKLARELGVRLFDLGSNLPDSVQKKRIILTFQLFLWSIS